jgi:uncharacterized protein YjbI with pentapeptide repeats
MRRDVSRILLVAAAIIVAVIVVAAVLWFLFGPLSTWLAGPELDRLDAKDRIAALSTIRGQVATVLSAAFVAGGLYYTGRKFVLDRDKQYTDRFTNAVDQLGSADVTVRAGGHRALDRILHDSARDRDRVLRTVTGYLRTHPVSQDKAPVPDDIAAAIATIRDRGAAPRGRTEVLDLRGIAIANTDLSGLDLRHADLTGSDLTGADLSGTQLRGARLDKANLRDTNLTGASLSGAHAVGAVLAGAVARGADFSGCDLTKADLTEIDLTDAVVDGAVLVSTDLSGADLRSTRGLTDVQLARARVNPATSLPTELG